MSDFWLASPSAEWAYMLGLQLGILRAWLLDLSMASPLGRQLGALMKPDMQTLPDILKN